MLFAFDGHAVPLDDTTVAYLREQEIVEDGATLDDAQRFVEHQVKAEECYDLYVVLRKANSDEKQESKGMPNAECRSPNDEMPNAKCRMPN